MGFDFSVIVLIYQPVKEKLLATLRSVVMQRECSFEVIISDDGSENFDETIVHDFMRACAFSDYRVITHGENQGTVKNLLDAVVAARGRYIKPISPGDYLYDATTLRDVLSFMEQQEAKIVFGDMICYTYDGQLRVANSKTPCDDEMYLPDRRDYNTKKVLKHQMIYADNVSGAAVFYERHSLQTGLETICGTVIYAEDAVIQLFALQNIRLYKMPRFLVWYEYGCGISTNPEKGFSSRLRRDFFGFYAMLHNAYKKAPCVKRTYYIWKIMMEAGRTANLLRCCVNVDKQLFLLRRRSILRKFVCRGYDTTFFHVVCGTAAQRQSGDQERSV